MNDGIVKWFCPRKGFGFIICHSGREVFVHYSSIAAKGYKLLKPGAQVTFDLYEAPDGRYTAKNVIAQG